MPYRDDPSDTEAAGPPNEESFRERSGRQARRMWDGFIDFALQGNILEIAFGLM
jgi:large conductance mechanosensitive channel